MPDNTNSWVAKLKEAQAELDRTRAELSKLKVELQNTSQSVVDSHSANLSHAIRVPLNTILGFGQLLRSASAATAESLEAILHAGHQMLEAINELDRPAAAAGLSAGAATETQKPVRAFKGDVLTVLYIEDNAANVMLVQHILQQRPNIRLLSASCGSEGLELAQVSVPDLILLDLNLPDMDGAQVMQKFREARETEGVPVVVLSADALPSRIERLLAAGARNYLTKPFDVTRFLNTVDEALAERRSQGQRD